MDPDAAIDHDAPLTPYRQLSGILRARIQRGDFPTGRLPSESQLVQQYGLARSTVRRAVGVLIEDGEAFRVPQRGTFVAKPDKLQR